MSEEGDFYGSEQTGTSERTGVATSEHKISLAQPLTNGQEEPSEQGSELSYQQSEEGTPKKTKDLDLLKSILHNASDSGSQSEKGESVDKHSSGSSAHYSEDEDNKTDKPPTVWQDSLEGNTTKRKPGRSRRMKRIASAKKGRRAMSAVNSTKRSSESPSQHSKDGNEDKPARRYSEDDINVNKLKLNKEKLNQNRRKIRGKVQYKTSQVEPQSVNAAYSLKLEEKYAELRELVNNNYVKKNRGVAGRVAYENIHPPNNPPPPRKRHTHHRHKALANNYDTGVMDVGTLGDGRMEITNGDNLNEGEIGVVIDVNTGKARHIQFANSSDRKSKAKAHDDKPSENKSNQQKGGRSRSAKKRPKSPKGHHFNAHEEGSSTVFTMAAPGAPTSPERSPSKSPVSSRSSSVKSYSSDSVEDESRGRSRSPVFHQLKVTENDRILSWLKEKNKLYRQQKIIERKKKREERKKRQKEMEEKEEKEQKVEQVVGEWMKKKKKEARLLRKRGRQDNTGGLSGLKFSGTVTISQTVDLKDGESVNQEGAIAAEETTSTEAKPNAKISAKMTTDKKVNVNMKGFESPSKECTCGFVQSQRLKEAELKQHRAAERAARIQSAKARPSSAKKSTKKPQNASNATGKSDSSSQAEEKSRLAYNEWLKRKQKQALLEAKKKKQEMKELADQSDPEMDKVVSKMARKRIDKIKEGQKSVDTGIKAIDDEANKSLEKKALDEETDKVCEETDGDEPITDGKQIPAYKWKKSPDQKAPQRPASARPASSNRPTTARGGRPRPNSAKPSLKASQPLRSGVSPVPAKGKPDYRPSSAASSRPYSPQRRPPSPDKPKMTKTQAYKKVKYQQESWDDFSEFVWEDVNKGVDGKRPEPQGSDDPEVPTPESGSKEDQHVSAEAGDEETEVERVEEDNDEVRDEGQKETEDTDEKETEPIDQKVNVPEITVTCSEEGLEDEENSEKTDKENYSEGNGQPSLADSEPEKDDNLNQEEKVDADKVDEQEETVAENSVIEEPIEQCYEQDNADIPKEEQIKEPESELKEKNPLVFEEDHQGLENMGQRTETTENTTAEQQDTEQSKMDDDSVADSPLPNSSEIETNIQAPQQEEQNAPVAELPEDMRLNFDQFDVDNPLDEEPADQGPPPHIEIVYDEASKHEPPPQSILKDEPSPENSLDSQNSDKKAKHVTFLTSGENEDEEEEPEKEAIKEDKDQREEQVVSNEGADDF